MRKKFNCLNSKKTHKRYSDKRLSEQIWNTQEKMVVKGFAEGLKKHESGKWYKDLKTIPNEKPMKAL